FSGLAIRAVLARLLLIGAQGCAVSPPPQVLAVFPSSAGLPQPKPALPTAPPTCPSVPTSPCRHTPVSPEIPPDREIAHRQTSPPRSRLCRRLLRPARAHADRASGIHSPFPPWPAIALD